MVDPTDPLPDKLRIFVSSTIVECSAERGHVRDAIRSLNHEPFLFEHAGARSSSPKDLYLSKLRESQIFIAIYRDSYGWIAEGESASGIENEYRHATKRGMPCLIYVHADDVRRDPRLRSIIQEIQTEGRFTYSRYVAAPDLYERVRNDVVAEVSHRYVLAEQIVRSAPSRDAEALLRGRIFVARPAVTQEILKGLTDSGVVQLAGEPGSGKTTLLASISEEHGFIFVSATGLTPLDLANAIAGKLEIRRGNSPEYYVTLDTAYAAIRNAGAHNDPVTLVIDGIEDVAVMQSLLVRAEIVAPSKSISVVYSVRESQHLESHRVITMPRLNAEEVAEFIANEGKEIEQGQLQRILGVSRGNPLLLRYCLESAGQDYEQGLTQFEAERWHALEPNARELVAYVALCRTILSLSDLMQLASVSAKSPEAFYLELEKARWFLTEDSLGFSIRHEHQRETVLNLLATSPQKRGYYARRVAQLLQSRRDYVNAYWTLEDSGDSGAAQLAIQAINQEHRAAELFAVELF